MAKLVDILARELEKWPEDATCITQDDGGCMNGGTVDYPPVLRGNAWGEGAFYLDDPDNTDLVMSLSQADDYQSAIVTKEQWQAERDRQKGGEWKRHRGNSQPVDELAYVEVKLRCGDIQKGLANEFLWRHADCDVAANIMKYRIISQPQAEGVAPMSNPVKSFDPYGAGHADHEPCHVQFIEAKTDQIDGPIKWRDQIVELEAHAEDIQREIASLFAKLNSEGFQLIRWYPVVSADVQIVIPYEDWADGDVVRCVKTSRSLAALTIGKEYTVIYEQGRIGVIDDEGDHMASCIEQGELEFVRRP